MFHNYTNPTFTHKLSQAVQESGERLSSRHDPKDPE